MGLIAAGGGANVCMMMQVSKSAGRGAVTRGAAARGGPGGGGGSGGGGAARGRRSAAARNLARALDAGLFKALGDATRLHLLGCLAGCCRPCSVSEVAACCAVDLSVVSRHLAQLEAAGVLRSHREGKSVLYAVAFEALGGALRRLGEAVAECDPAQRGVSYRCGCLGCKPAGAGRKEGCC
ncbi:hypothetical protein BH11PLA1_BH11PLA1_12960 [soil metagenome]